MLQTRTNTKTKKSYSKTLKPIMTSLETVTPTTAAAWLGKSDNVRGLNEWRAKEMAEQMKAGDWELNGESVKFDRDGKLVDGQHRLKACMLAKTNFQTIVVRNVESAHNVDTGYKRSLYQVLAHEGIPDGHRLGPAINYIINYGKYKSLRPSGRHPKVSINEGVRFMRANPSLSDIYSNLSGTKNVFGHDSVHIAMYYLLMKATNKETADKFYLPLVSGLKLTASNPIYLLRERLIKERGVVHRTLPAQLYAGWIIKAWNLWLKGAKTKVLRYDYDKEGLPVIATK